ncbi:TIGR03619 family F420-dependent LLM class oxidoreductase [Streptomyces purpureus]|uniref:TIGR03619 family F420-dependent LLM class oxidoreductase n=1 Tax=Streptomyces purpureus TaxID=1951 RepID=UPI000491607B|nr:TIGR03619 family F420-dependent LLM class oxidoreductase [Streptomyces purpureus]
MDFGVNLLNFGTGTTPASLAQQALDARDFGYTFAMISDHIAVTADVDAVYPSPFYDQFALAAFLAGRVPGLTLGTSVTVVPYRHPLHTARLAANVDQLCEGGFILDAGIGWSEPEFEVLGVEFKDRGRISDEYLAVIRGAWREDPYSFRGAYVSFDGVRTSPAPASRPGIPVWVGGDSPAALRRAARFGEAWHPYKPSVRRLRAALPVLAAEADAAGRAAPALAPRLHLRVTERPLGEDRPAGHGTSDQIRRDLWALAELGATHVLFDTYAGFPELTRGTAREDRALLERVVTRFVDPVSGTPR